MQPSTTRSPRAGLPPSKTTSVAPLTFHTNLTNSRHARPESIHTHCPATVAAKRLPAAAPYGAPLWPPSAPPPKRSAYSHGAAAAGAAGAQPGWRASRCTCAHAHMHAPALLKGPARLGPCLGNNGAAAIIAAELLGMHGRCVGQRTSRIQGTFGAFGTITPVQLCKPSWMVLIDGRWRPGGGSRPPCLLLFVPFCGWLGAARLGRKTVTPTTRWRGPRAGSGQERCPRAWRGALLLKQPRRHLKRRPAWQGRAGRKRARWRTCYVT